MRAILALALAALTAGAAAAELRIAGDAAVAPHKMARLQAQGQAEGSALLWRFDKAKLDAGRHGDRLWLTGPPGRYVVECIAIRLGPDGKTVVEEAELTLVIGDAPPGPGPTPPPPDADPLVKALRPAWEADAGPSREKHTKALAALYRQAPSALEKVTTAGELQKALKDAAAILLPADALPKTRAAVAGELKAVLPAKAAEPLTDMHKNQARSLFGRLAEALEGLR